MSCGQIHWVPLIEITGYVSYAMSFMVKQPGGIQYIPITIGVAQFSGLFKNLSTCEILEIIKQDWNHLVLIYIYKSLIV
jgi:hypothetical protein